MKVRLGLFLAAAIGIAACARGFEPPAPAATSTPPPLGAFPPEFVFVANPGNDTITEYQFPGGTLIRTISEGVNQPRSLAVDYDGNLYSGNFGANNITVYDRDGNLIRTIRDGVNGPYGLNASRAGMIYSANYASVTGYAIGDTAPRVTITQGIAGAKSVTTGADVVFVANTSINTITEYPIGNVVSVLDTIATPSSPLALAADSQDDLLVSTCSCGGAAGGAYVYWGQGALQGQMSPPVPLHYLGTQTGPVAISGIMTSHAPWVWLFVGTADRTYMYPAIIGSGYPAPPAVVLGR